MFRSVPGRQRPLRRGLQRNRFLWLEWLEPRTLLAADFRSVADFSALQIDPDAYDPSSVLVRFREGALPTAGVGGSTAAGVVGAGRVESLLSWRPELARLALPAGIDVPSALAALRSDPNVLYAEPDYRVRIADAPSDPRFDEMWGLQNLGQTGGREDADIDAEGAWEVHTGTGSMLVAVIDTGVDYNHPDLASNIWTNLDEVPGDGIDNDSNGYIDDVHGYDFHNDDNNPMDDNGHGTHVAGTIGAVGNNGVGVTGINWAIQVMALKFLGADGSGSSSAAIEAINYAVANGARLSNNSWGGDPFSQAMFDAIESARDAGHVFVAAAGNGNLLGIGQNNDTTPFYPAGYDLNNIVAVAATDNNDNLAGFSNFGATTVDLAAPGVDILSTTPGGAYGLNTGTSMASPHVAGAIALVWDAHPEWTYDEVIAQVLGTVDSLPALQGVTVTGGRLNLASALDNPQPPPPPPPPGTLPVVEDFQDNKADFLDPRAGNWSVGSGRYHVTPSADDDNLAGVSTLRLDAPLPNDFEIRTIVNADEGHVEFFGFVFSDFLTNGLIVFDYHAADDFKFAGADMDGDRWVIGRRTASGWAVDAQQSQTLNASTDYSLRVVVEGGSHVTLYGNGAAVATHTFGESVVDGDAGVGARNSSTHFDNVVARPFVPVTPGALPHEDDFEDGVADHFQEQTGIASVTGGRLLITPFTGGDGVSTFLSADPLPGSLAAEFTFNADDGSASRQSNAFFIFDYQGPSDFKFAGAYVGIDEWLIGHRDAGGWVTDAYVGASVDALLDYTVRVELDPGGRATLSVGGVQQVAHDFGEVLTDHPVGFGTKNSITRFDDVLLEERAGPPAPTPGTLPLAENFDDNVADHLLVQSGQANVTGGRYHVTPEVGGDGVSTVLLSDPLPGELEIEVVFNADGGSANRASNAFVIFDYQGPTDFKFAGAYVGIDEWLIGHRTASGWVTGSYQPAPIDPLTDYALRVEIEESGLVTLFANGTQQVSHQFAGGLTDGPVGIGTKNAVSRFDDLTVHEVTVPPGPMPATLPLFEDFNDGIADSFQVLAGQAAVVGGRYHFTPNPGGDGIAALHLADALPATVEAEFVFNADDAVSGRASNAFFIFDYQSPTDFKFAGAYVGIDEWLIGHRDASGWVTDSYVGAPIAPLTDYVLRIEIGASGLVTLFANGTQQVSHQYGDSLTDGAIGLGTKNALSRFDDLSVQELVAPGGPEPAPLPVFEDFADGVADHLLLRSGQAEVVGGRYHVTPELGGDGISTFVLADPLPGEYEAEFVFNASGATSGRSSNAFLIFDYQGPTNFKFAGAYVGIDEWLIGHRGAFGWVTDAHVSAVIDAHSDYTVLVEVSETGVVSLFAGGLLQVSRQYGEDLTDGDVGVGTKNSVTSFDNLSVRQSGTLQALGGRAFDDAPPDESPVPQIVRLSKLRVHDTRRDSELVAFLNSERNDLARSRSTASAIRATVDTQSLDFAFADLGATDETGEILHLVGTDDWFARL